MSMTVKQYQCALEFLDYNPGQIDGVCGKRTEEALKAFQKAENLRVDGVFGPETEGALLDAMVHNRVRKPDAPPGVIVETGTWWDEIRYFTRAEFRCPCPRCGGFPAEPQELLVRIVDEIRHRAGVPIGIVDSGGSGVRCPERNVEVGGAVNSEHLYGRAADLHSLDGSVSPKRLYEIAVQVMAEKLPGRGGIGLYNWGIHVDTGKYSRWNG